MQSVATPFTSLAEGLPMQTFPSFYIPPGRGGPDLMPFFHPTLSQDNFLAALLIYRSFSDSVYFPVRIIPHVDVF